jgi:tRNA-Thr(GGU) m(6)t(6)A37 methyltransferase TsaA
MKRRTVLLGLPAGLLAAAGCSSGGSAAARAPEAAAAGGAQAGRDEKAFTMLPIGRVEAKGDAAGIRIFDAYADGLLGLDQWSHVQVFYWFDKNDTPEHRRVLRVNPRGNRENPLTGVFACRSPFRPNLIALTVCRIVAVEGGVVRLDKIDAFDGTPVLDLKPFTPADAPTEGVRVPDWARRGPGGPAGGKGA